MQPPINHASWAIEASGLSKSFGETIVLQDLQLNIVAGEFLVVLGDSGCGKSTLLKLITGLECQQMGTIRIHGKDQSRIAPHRRDVAIVFQDGNGYDHLSVRNNLNLVAKVSNNGAQVAEWVERLRIGHTLEQRLDQLSGGELQRVAIARAMLSDKSIVLLDEPLSHLNPSLREEIRDLLLAVHRDSKKTFVYVTHDSDEAFYLADRIAVLTEKRIVQVDEPRSIYRKSTAKSVAKLLGQPTIDIVSLPRSLLSASTAVPLLSPWPVFVPDQGTTVEGGFRCHDWAIRCITVHASCDEETARKGLSVSESELVLHGTIHSCHWMGSRWLLNVECQGNFRIVCVSGKDAVLESELLQAEKLTKTLGGARKAIGTVEARYPIAMVQWFKGTQP